MLWLSFRLNSPESCLAEIEWKNTSADDPNNNNKKKALCPGFLAHFWWLLSSTEMLCGTLVPSRHAGAEDKGIIVIVCRRLESAGSYDRMARFLTVQR